jgi:hypothetical protein
MTTEEYNQRDAEFSKQEKILRSRIQATADMLLHAETMQEGQKINAALSELLAEDRQLTETRMQLLGKYSAQSDEEKQP